MSLPIKRCVAFLLSGLVLISTWGYSVDQHFCQGNLISTRFFSSAPSCSGKKKEVCPVHSQISDLSTTSQVHKPPCCQNTGSYVHIDINGKSASEFSTINQVSRPTLALPVDNLVPEQMGRLALHLPSRWVHPPPVLRTDSRWTSSFRC